jgi:hypothetical protein
LKTIWEHALLTSYLVYHCRVRVSGETAALGDGDRGCKKAPNPS